MRSLWETIHTKRRLTQNVRASRNTKSLTAARKLRKLRARSKRFAHGVRVVDAPAPGPAAQLLKRRPQASVFRQRGIRGEVRVRRALAQFIRGPDKIHRAFQSHAINDDANAIAIAQFADR